MEGRVFPNKPPLPSQAPPRNPSSLHTNHSIKPPSSLPITPHPTLDSLLHHLTAPTTAPTLSRGILPATKSGDPHFSFLTDKGKSLVSVVAAQELATFLDTHKDDILQPDLTGILKALEQFDHWEWALSILMWAARDADARESKLDEPAIEAVVRAIGRAAKPSAACKLLEEISLSDYCLDIRAYTTMLHCLSEAKQYGKAVALLEDIRTKGVMPTLVMYNVMLGVYRRMGGSWSKIVQLVGDMRSNGLAYDQFTCSIVIAACGFYSRKRKSIGFRLVWY